MSEEKTQPKKPDIKEIMTDYDKAIRFFSETPAEVWEALGDKTAIDVFDCAIKNIPAYQDFIKNKSASQLSIKSVETFTRLPTIDKHNYIESYEFNDLNLVKAGKNLYSYSLSSGTADIPTIWPRSYEYEEFLPLILEKLFRLYWEVDKKSTFIIDALTLGSWTAGFLIYSGIRPLTRKYNITLATPGSDLANIILAIKKFSKYYDQTVIIGYTTFIRTILERLESEKINIRGLNLKLLIGGEGHPMEWREYINNIISGNPNDLLSIMDTYGTSDSGMLGFGIALTSLIRRLASKDKKLCLELFKREGYVPTLMQYNPTAAYLEEVNGDIVITSKNTIPLVRYNIHDRGGLIKFREMERILKKHGYDYKKILEDEGLPVEMVWQQPFVFLFGRREDTISVAAAKVYPEQLAPVLLCEETIHDFKLKIHYDKKMRQIFRIYIELKEGNSLTKGLRGRIKKKQYHDAIVNCLINTNIDFADAYKLDKKVADPKIIICERGTGPFAKERDNIKPRLVIN